MSITEQKYCLFIIQASGEHKLFETSALDDSRQDNVEAIFLTLAFKLKDAKPFYVPNQLHRARVQSIDHQNLNSSSNASSTDNGSCYC